MSDNPLPMTDDGMPVIPGGTYWLDVDTRVVALSVCPSSAWPNRTVPPRP